LEIVDKTLIRCIKRKELEDINSLDISFYNACRFTLIIN